MMQIIMKNISKSFKSGKKKIEVLKQVNLKVEQGDFLGIIGVSGTGKTTLLNIISCLESPTEGMYLYNSSEINQLKQSEKEKFRKKNFSYILQSDSLITDLTVSENIALPLKFRKHSRRIIQEKIHAVLLELDMLDKKDEYIKNLSGGQIQRVAIARAIVQDAEVILADEPTGSLDKQNSIIVMDILKKVNEEKKVTIILVTHDLSLLSYCNKIYELEEK
ncbi:MAG: ABC transporter ATP-binding protein [Culicoidibacterales bacterium]